ncbi:Rv3235 family protein [Microlunatus speluncae]|uniref:Rv3235 family protein n=1 Tax=Microlunatus speluncae TaxID=2594267 RepID=UPI0012666367|nr:Rv3235 family protein [Microlunatus speluncae]
MAGLRVLPVIDSRPPSVSWFAGLAPPLGAPAAQPSLLELSGLPDRPSPDAPATTTAAPAWQARPDPRLPDAGPWAASLGLAAVEVVRGRRPIGQLSRWVTEDQLERLAKLAARPPRTIKATARARPVLQARVQSARVQHPGAEVAEAAVHVRIGPLSVPVALRLDAVYDRWLVTALEFGPRG